MTTTVALLPTQLLPTQRDLVLAGPVGSLDAYVQAVGQVPLLSQAEETDSPGASAPTTPDAARRLVVSQLRSSCTRPHWARTPAGRPDPGGQRRPHEGSVSPKGACGCPSPHRSRRDPRIVLRNWRGEIATTRQRKLFFNLRRAKQRSTRGAAIAATRRQQREVGDGGAAAAVIVTPLDADEDASYAPALYLAREATRRALEADDWQESEDRCTRRGS